jgi:sugar phosphate isomerase/epimerase
MDTFFNNSLGSYQFDARCEILRELGFDATYLTLFGEYEWSCLPALATVQQRFGLSVAGVYASIDLAADLDKPGAQRVLKIFEQLPENSDLELSIKCGDKSVEKGSSAGDDLARRWLEPLLKSAERTHSRVNLYPHINCYVERVEDAVRLCKQIEHPALKTVFCGFHWFAVDGKNLPARIALAAPHLNSVNICGCRHGGTVAGNSIEPLDSGTLDNFALLGLLRKHGYSGKIGFQGFSIGGDAYAALRRSLAAYRDMVQRLDRFPRWAELNFKAES